MVSININKYVNSHIQIKMTRQKYFTHLLLALLLSSLHQSILVTEALEIINYLLRDHKSGGPRQGLARLDTATCQGLSAAVPRPPERRTPAWGPVRCPPRPQTPPPGRTCDHCGPSSPVRGKIHVIE